MSPYHLCDNKYKKVTKSLLVDLISKSVVCAYYLFIVLRRRLVIYTSHYQPFWEKWFSSIARQIVPYCIDSTQTRTAGVLDCPVISCIAVLSLLGDNVHS